VTNRLEYNQKSESKLAFYNLD